MWSHADVLPSLQHQISLNLGSLVINPSRGPYISRQPVYMFLGLPALLAELIDAPDSMFFLFE